MTKTSVRCVYDDGDHTDTWINATYDQAVDYFLDSVYYAEDERGNETAQRCVKVIEL